MSIPEVVNLLSIRVYIISPSYSVILRVFLIFIYYVERRNNTHLEFIVSLRENNSKSIVDCSNLKTISINELHWLGKNTLVILELKSTWNILKCILDRITNLFYMNA